MTASRPGQHLKEPDESEDCKSISALSEAGDGVEGGYLVLSLLRGAISHCKRGAEGSDCPRGRRKGKACVFAARC